MKSSWTKGHPDKEAREKQVRSYKNAFDDLRDILEKEYIKKPACRDYSDAGWHHQQIAINEYNQAIDDLLSLITITKD